jgi:hypothetical protein
MYSNSDEVAMKKSIHQAIHHIIQQSQPGDLFVVSDFLMLGSYEAVKRALARMAEAGQLTRVLRGLYQKADTVPPSVYDVAFALARHHAWTIVPAEDTALHLLEFTHEAPKTITFVSDGPYRTYPYNQQILVFKRRSAREIKGLSFQTALVCEALKAIGENALTEEDKDHLRQRYNSLQLAKMVEETQRSRQWVHTVLKSL